MILVILHRILQVTGALVLALLIGMGFTMLVPLPLELLAVYVSALVDVFLKSL